MGIVLWTGLLINAVGSIVQRLHGAIALEIACLTTATALCGVYARAFLTQRTRAERVFAPRERMVAYSFIAPHR